MIREKEGIALLGAGMDLVTIDGNAEEQEDFVPGILIEDSQGITVRGFTITNGRRGLEATGCTDLVITENVFDRNMREAVDIESCDVELTGNIIRDTKPDLDGGYGMGIAISASYAVLVDNTITGNADMGLFATTVDGPCVVTGSGNTIQGNKAGDLCGSVSTALLVEPPPAGTEESVSVPEDAATITEALDLVRPGGTITLAAGTYQEFVQIYKSVTIQGAGPGQTILQAPGPDWAVLNVATGDMQVVVAGLTVTGGRYGTSVLTDADSQVALRDVRVEDTGTAECPTLVCAILIQGETVATLENVASVRNNAYGLFCYGPITVEVRNCSVSENRADGVVLRVGVEATIRNSTIFRNEGDGISVEDTTATIQDNEIAENGQDGIIFSDASSGTVRGNRCSGNAYNGIGVGDQAIPTLEENTCTENEEIGIAYWDTSGGTARGNTCSENTYHGIEVGDEAAPTLEANTCTRNEGNGIGFWDSGGGTARNNECLGNLYYGIGVHDEARPTIEGNACSENSYIGIAYFDASGGFSRRNTCERNGIDGIAVNDSASPTLENNTCSNNEEAGIAFYDRSRGTARGNVCRLNEWGIYVAETANPRLVANRCTGNRDLDVWDERD